MDFSAEWKSIFPISSAFSPPLFHPNSKTSQIGPLFFSFFKNTPKTLLFQHNSLSPNLPPLFPNLTLSRFLINDHFTPSSLSSTLGPQIPDYSSIFNSFQLLRVPDKDYVIGFFPAGDNLGLVGFSLFRVKDGIFTVFERNGSFFKTAKKGGNGRITRILVNQVDDFVGDYSSKDLVVGFLMVCTDYSVCWFRVLISGLDEKTKVLASLDYLGCADCEILKGGLVVSACWSPYLREECVVLLENGDFMLFEVNRLSRVRNERIVGLVRGTTEKGFRKRMRVTLNDKVSELVEDGCGEGWFGCEFSWHPRKVIVCCSRYVFMVDFSRFSGDCEVSCLLKLERFSMVKNDAFMSVSRAGSDGFYYTVATRRLLLLCDVRKPLMPVLRWAHEIKNPRYLTVFRLSELRANAEDDKYQWASESGYCILLGSFWDSEFRLFCYGPSLNDEPVASEINKFCNSLYAWGIPSEFLLSDRNCTCGSCLVKHEFSKASLPVWIDWRQREDLVLGLGILEADISKRASKPNSSGGFVMIRLMSSGKLEAQQYHAQWELEKNCKIGNKRKHILSKDGCLYDGRESEYDGVKKFQHFTFDYLQAFLDDYLAKFMVSKIEETTGSREDSRTKSKSDFHVEICQKLKDLGFLKGASMNVSDVLKDVSLPTSIHEVALRSMWASLPTNLLQLGFSTYKDLQDEIASVEPLEFLDIPQQFQLPPFPLRRPSKRSNKWSHKVQPYNTLIGTILPPQFLTTLNKLRIEELKLVKELYREETEEFSTSFQMKKKCDEVMGVVKKQDSLGYIKTEDDDHVSLSDDRYNFNTNSRSQTFKFLYHQPSAFLGNSVMKKSEDENEVSSLHVIRRRKKSEYENDYFASRCLSTETAGQGLLDVGCPVELKFDNRRAFNIDFGSKEVELLRMLKKREIDFQKGFEPFQNYINGGTKLQ